MPLYNIGGYVRIDGPIDLTLFKQALGSVIVANDALQVILHKGKGLPTQTFAEDAPWEMDFRDFSEGIDPHQAALTWMQQKFSEPFSLYGRLLFRVALCKVADNCCYWLNTYHHIINDGWGISLVVQRVAATYNALVSGQTITVPSYSYRDVIQDDQDYLNSRRYIKDRNYWQNKYRELPKPMLTSSYTANFQVRAIPSQRATLRLPWDFYHRLTEFAETHQASTFHVILGTFYCYFTRINHRNDLAVGLPTLNRKKATLKQTVGPFSGINPAWFCLGTSGNFIWLIEAIGKELRADYRHQNLPMIQITREVSTHRDQKLFDFTLSYARHNFDVHFDGAPTQSSFLANGFYPQDHGLFITIEEFHRQEDVNIHFDYNSGFFEKDEIQCLIDRFEFLLKEILRQPDIPILELPIIPDSERNRHLEFHHNGFACHSIEEGIVYMKSIHDVTHISDIVFDEQQDASVCLIRTKAGISIELVAGNQVRSLLNRGSRLYHVCYEVPDLFSAIEWLITKGYRGQDLSGAERAKIALARKRAKEEHEREREQTRREAAQRATALWAKTQPASPDHPYLARKQIQPHGARSYNNQLVLPVLDFTGQLTSLQFISPTKDPKTGRDKTLLKGGRKQGGYIPVAGDPANYSSLLICEGWATGCSLAENEPSALVVAAIDAGNLEAVARAVRCDSPTAEIIIAGDDDRKTPGNPGVTQAIAAAEAADAKVMFPRWPDDAPEQLTDFNDLAVWLNRGVA